MGVHTGKTTEAFIFSPLNKGPELFSMVSSNLTPQ